MIFKGLESDGASALGFTQGEMEFAFAPTLNFNCVDIVSFSIFYILLSIHRGPYISSVCPRPSCECALTKLRSIVKYYLA